MDETYGVGLLDCCGSSEHSDCCARQKDVENCCYVWWCQSCAVGKLAARAPPSGGFPGSGNCALACFLSWLLKPVPFADVCIIYLPLRKGLAPPSYQWNACDECCVLWYCLPCALCQELNASDRRIEAGKPVWATITKPPPEKRMR